MGHAEGKPVKHCEDKLLRSLELVLGYGDFSKIIIFEICYFD